jgi:hypothetical protein
MRCLLIKLVVSLATFSLGLFVDDYLRTRNSGITDCACMTFKCRAITVAEHPLTALMHPAETFEYLGTYSYWG